MHKHTHARTHIVRAYVDTLAQHSIGIGAPESFPVSFPCNFSLQNEKIEQFVCKATAKTTVVNVVKKYRQREKEWKTEIFYFEISSAKKILAFCSGISLV